MAPRRPRRSARPRLDPLETRDLLAVLTFRVLNANDSGPGSLRLAIIETRAETSPTSQTTFRIAFDIPGSGVHTITPVSPLPALADFTTVDGSTEPGYAGKPNISIDGSKAGAGAEGLAVHTGSEVLDLAVSGFSGDQVLMDGDGSVLQGDDLGVNPTSPDVPSPGGAGVSILGATNTLIGGVNSSQANIISGNKWGVFGSGAKSDSIIGNIIGLDPAQAIATGNSIAGVLLVSSSGNAIGGMATGDGNVIAGSPYGVELTSPPGAAGNQDEVIAANALGQSSVGQSFPNTAFDLYLDFNTQGTTVAGNAIEPVGSAATAPRVHDVNYTTRYSGNFGFDPTQHAVDIAASTAGFGTVNPQGQTSSTFQGEVTVENKGTSAATGVIVEVDLSADADFSINAYQAPSGVTIPGFTRGEHSFFIDYGTVAAGASVSVKLAGGLQNATQYRGSIVTTAASDGIDTDGGDKKATAIL